MNNDDIRVLAGEYVLGLLEGDTLHQAETLLRDDAHFAALVESWERDLMPFAEASPDIAPPPQLWDRISAHTHPARRRFDRLKARFSRRFRFASFGLGSALAVAVLLYALPSPPESGRQIAALSNRDGGSFIVVQTKTAIIVTPQNVTLPPGRVAELWMLAPDHAPRAIGIFRSGQAIDVKLPKLQITGLSLAVSLEPPGGAPGAMPTGPIVAEVAITNL